MAATIQQIVKPTRARGLDTSGNNNHAQIYSGRALEFDGVTDYLDTGSNIPISTDKWTLAVWININTTPASNADNIISAGGTYSSNYLGFDTNRKLTIYDLGNTTYRDSNTALNLNTWYRVVYSYDGAGTLTFYVNGVADGTATLATAGDDDDLYIRYVGMLSNSTRFFDGMMSDLQAWDLAWTADDAMYDYLNPEQLALNRGGTSLTNSNLKLWYPMNEGHRGNQSYVLDASNTGICDNIVDSGITAGTTKDGWVDFDTGDTQVTVDSDLNAIKYTYLDSTSGMYAYLRDSYILTKDLVVGNVYKISYKVKVSDSSFNVNFKVQGASITGSPQGGATNSTEFVEQSFNILAVNTTGHYIFGLLTGTVVSEQSTIWLKDFKVEPINDKHNATTAFYGDNTISATNDKTMAGSNNWGAYGTGTTESVTGGKLRVTTTTANAVQGASLAVANAGTPVVGRTYRIRANLKRVSGLDPGTITMYYGDVAGTITTVGGGGTSGQITDSEVQYETTIVAGSATGGLLIVNPATTTALVFEIDDVEIKEVGVASGWTDADQQLDIPQTALQSYNQLAWFDGRNNYVSIADHNDFSFTDGSNDDESFSLSAWINMNDATNFPIICKDSSSHREWSFVTGSTDKLTFWVFDNSAGAYQGRYYNAALTSYEGKWIHVVATYNGNESDADAGVAIYLNGEVIDDTNFSGGSYEGMENKDSVVAIGARLQGNLYANGAVTECSIWNKELSATEVTELYNDGLALNATTHSGSSNLIGYWRNNGLATWQDLTGNNRDGTPTNITETMLITAGVDSSRDSQGFFMNRQRTTNSLNFPSGTEADLVPGYAKVSNSDTIKLTGSYTIAAWVKLPLTGNDYQRIVALETGANGTNGYGMYVHTDGKVLNACNNSNQTSASARVTADTWTYITVTADGTNRKIYTNGVQTDTETNSNDAAATTSDLFIGKSGGLSDRQVSGAIDDVILYNTALDAPEILRNYKAGKRSHR
jgi:hypothetical protein